MPRIPPRRHHRQRPTIPRPSWPAWVSGSITVVRGLLALVVSGIGPFGRQLLEEHQVDAVRRALAQLECSLLIRHETLLVRHETLPPAHPRSHSGVMTSTPTSNESDAVIVGGGSAVLSAPLDLVLADPAMVAPDDLLQQLGADRLKTRWGQWMAQDDRFQMSVAGEIAAALATLDSAS